MKEREETNDEVAYRFPFSTSNDRIAVCKQTP